jgi:hypothetical protein
MKTRITKLELLLLVALISPFIILLFHSQNFFMTHDGRYHLERTFYFLDSYKEGNFVPSWSRYYNQGFGSPILIFLFPIAYWISSFLYGLFGNLVVAVKLDFIFFAAVGAASIFFFLKNSLKLQASASLIAAAVYLYAPYSLVQIFVRGSLREFAGMMLVPLVLYALSLKKFWISAVVIAVFLLTDGITAMVFSPVIIGYWLILFWKADDKKSFFFSSGCSAGLALILGGFIIFPYVFERSNLLWNNAATYRDHFVYFSQLLNLRWGFGFSMPGPADSMSFQIGVVNIFAVLSGTIILFRNGVRRNPLPTLFTGIFFLSLFLLLNTPPTQWLWENLKPLQSVQLPWRFLAPVCFSAAFLAGWVANNWKLPWKITLVTLLFIVALDFRYLRTNEEVVFSPGSYVKNPSDATAFHEFIPTTRVTTSQFSGFPQKVELSNSAGSVSNLKESNNTIAFDLSSPNPVMLRLNTLYFPGWKAYVDGKDVIISVAENPKPPAIELRDISGLMQISVPAGVHKIEFRFEDTAVRRVGKAVTLFGLTILGLLIGKAIFKKSK